MFDRWFVSRKKYDELKEVSLRSQDRLIENQKIVDRLKSELDRQVAVNEELKLFSDKFEKFYQKVTKIPATVNQLGPAVGLTVSSFLDERSMSYSNVVESLKNQMIYEIAERLSKEGLVKFDLIDDPVTDRTVYKATIYVHKGV